MRGEDRQSGGLFSYVDLEAQVPADHPRPIRAIVDDALSALSGELEALYSHLGRPSIPPERLLRALLQAFYSVRSEQLLMEQLDYNLLFRWFVGLGSTIRCGTRPRSRSTATGCSRARSRPSS
jgi:transposase